MRTKTEEDPVAGGAVAANCWVGESDVIYFAAADAAAAAAAIALRQMNHGVCAAAVMRPHSLHVVVAVADP